MFLLFLLACKSTGDLGNNNNEAVLFEINDNPVLLSEFIYSYIKSHQQEDSVTRKSIDEYFDLFVNFKLKVREAKAAGYDTSKVYLAELHQYQEQLKSNYRSSEKLIEQLKEEAYERMSTEINASHILIRVDRGTSDDQNKKALEKIKKIREEAEKAPFDQLAQKYSEDPSAKANSGNLGYFSAFQMIYPFESAAYNTPVGGISDPVKTEYGYHILKVHDTRPGAYKVKLDQIVLRGLSEEAKNSQLEKTFELREMIRAGLTADQAKESIDKGEYQVQESSLPLMDFVKLPAEIKDVVYHLEDSGQISDPVESNLGSQLYILKEKVGLPSYSDMEQQLERMVRRSDRLKIYEEQILEKLKAEQDFTLLVTQDSLEDILTTDGNLNTTLISLDGRQVMLKDFKEYVQTRGEIAPKAAYQNFQKAQVYRIEDVRNIETNPELKWLLKEYEEGILLFNIMEDSVWNKAVEDKEGFSRYIDEQEKAMSDAKSSLDQAKSQQILEFQEYLEKIWIERLRKNYNIEINQQVVNKAYEELIN